MRFLIACAFLACCTTASPSEIAYFVQKEQAIYSYDLARCKEQKLTHAKTCYGITFAKNTLIFSSAFADTKLLTRVNLATKQTNLTQDEVIFPSASPDGSMIASYEREYGRLTVDGPRGILDVDDAIGGSQPSWNPEGNKFVYSKPVKGNHQVVVCDLAKRKLRTLFEGKDPSWSLDGRYIAYTKIKGRKTSVWRYDLESGEQRELLSHGSSAVWIERHRLVLLDDGSLYLFDLAKGTRERIRSGTSCVVAIPSGTISP